MNRLDFQRILGGRKISLYYSVDDLQQDLSNLEINGADQADVQPFQAEVLERIEQRRTFSPAQHHLPDTLALLQEDRAR